VIHDNYLINLASANEGIRKQSIEAFRGELVRGIAIGAEYLVAHPGNYKGQTIEEGIFHFLQGITAAAERTPLIESAIQSEVEIKYLDRFPPPARLSPDALRDGHRPGAKKVYRFSEYLLR